MGANENEAPQPNAESESEKHEVRRDIRKREANLSAPMPRARHKAGVMGVSVKENESWLLLRHRDGILTLQTKCPPSDTCI